MNTDELLSQIKQAISDEEFSDIEMYIGKLRIEVKELKRKKPVKKRITIADKLVSDFNYIMARLENCEDVPSLTTLAERAHTSRSTAMRALRTTRYGSYLQMLSETRIDMAKKMLGVFTVQEVADRTGFSESSVFYRFFKNETGMTPSEYLATKVERSGH